MDEQFLSWIRPATLFLDQNPYNVHSTTDGSCLLVSYGHESELTITAYHWDSFGSTEGIRLDIPPLPVDEPFVVTSLLPRTAVHVLRLDFSGRCLQSYALDITRRMTEFTFRPEKPNRSHSGAKNIKAHNCLIDCHSEVWIRFPVLAAVQRETISSASLRNDKSLVFITDRDFDEFAPYFSRMIHNFVRTSKKPTGDILKSIKVSAKLFPAFVQELCGSGQWNASQYRAGEWIVDLLCLIPIHIAVTKENRFVPLKDGIYSPELEKSLLGAEVNRIVDSISFGWYESLFQSYMSTKVNCFLSLFQVVLDRQTHSACQGGFVHGGAICWQELRAEPPCRHIICRISNAYNRGRMDVCHTDREGTNCSSGLRR